MNSFDHPINAVVQGASRGLGLAVVEQLLNTEQLAGLVATCRHPQQAEQLQQLAQQSEGRLKVTRLDVTDEEQIREAASFSADQFDELHLLLNVAGVLHDETRDVYPEKKLDDVRPDAALYNFRVNALGPLLVMKHFVGLLADDRRAVIANLSAKVGSIGANQLGGWYAHRGAKAAQNMFTHTAALEFKHHKRTRNAICVALYPGTVDTELSAPFQSNIPNDQIFSPSRAADQLLEVIDGLDPSNSGGFYDYAGESIPW